MQANSRQRPLTTCLALSLALMIALAAGQDSYARAADAQTASSQRGIPAALASSFAFDPAPPFVTLNPVPRRSNDATPSFSGTASETSAIVIDIYSGEAPEGSPVRTLEVEGTGGAWTSAALGVPLEDGTYTAVATQLDVSDATTTTSNPVTFEVDTQAPQVALASPPSPSNDTAPSFSGTASESSPVTVKVYLGTSAAGALVATATATPHGRAWTSDEVIPPLVGGDHSFTAVATQSSEIGNPAGTSQPVTFTVDTDAPLVTLQAPPSPSNDTTPSFEGRASEATPVAVEIFRGKVPEGEIVATAGASPSFGRWSSGDATPALGNGTFTAVASERSAISDASGESAPVTFTVDTSPPPVTLQAPPSPSADTDPTFSGTAGDDTPVTIDIYRGSRAEGAVVSSATAEAGGGAWTSSKASPRLTWGEYTALATEPSSLGNAPGSSAPVTFAVEALAPGAATETAAAVTRTSAAIYGSLDPEGAAVESCDFEYGDRSSYGQSVECGFLSEALTAFPPAATSAVPVFARIYGLRANTTYHFRLVALGEGGTGDGADQTFTTLPPWLFNETGSRKTASASLGRGALASLIGAQLARFDRMARIRALLKAGLFRGPYKAPEPGTAQLDWYYRLPPAKRRGKPAAAAWVLVASGRAVFQLAGTGAPKVRTTVVGRRLLSGSSRLALTSTCVFTPRGAASVTATREFELPL